MFDVRVCQLLFLSLSFNRNENEKVFACHFVAYPLKHCFEGNIVRRKKKIKTMKQRLTEEGEWIAESHRSINITVASIDIKTDYILSLSFFFCYHLGRPMMEWMEQTRMGGGKIFTWNVKLLAQIIRQIFKVKKIFI